MNFWRPSQRSWRAHELVPSVRLQPFHVHHLTIDASHFLNLPHLVEVGGKRLGRGLHRGDGGVSCSFSSGSRLFGRLPSRLPSVPRLFCGHARPLGRSPSCLVGVTTFLSSLPDLFQRLAMLLVTLPNVLGQLPEALGLVGAVTLNHFHSSTHLAIDEGSRLVKIEQVPHTGRLSNVRQGVTRCCC